MIIVTLFLFFLNILIKFIFELFSFKLIVVKILLLLGMVYLLYKLYTYPKKQRLRLSSLRKLKQFFPYSYKIYTTSEEVKSLCISICYFLFFILGILTLRFYNTSREVNVTIILNKVYSIFVKTSVGNLILNISLIAVSLALYYYSNGIP